MSTAGAVNTTTSSNDSHSSFGNTISQRKYRKQSDKLAKQKARLVFLLKCRRHKIYPRFIMDKVSHMFSKYDKAPTEVKRKLISAKDFLNRTMLNLEISLCNSEIYGIQRLIDELKDNVPEDTINKSRNNYEVQLKKSNQKVYKKFVKLTETQDHVEDIHIDDSFVKNLTTLEIPNEVKTVLSLGPKFAIMPGNEPLMDLASDVELVIKRELPIANQRTARGEADYTITKFSKQRKTLTRIDRFLQKALGKTREFLQQHKEVMVSNSDKGNVTIISNREEYHQKIEQLLSDVESFTALETDPTKTVANAVNRCLDNLYKMNILKKKLKTSLKSFNTIPPRLFAQIKYHKPGNPVRLIVSTINSAAYKLSRFLATILRKSFKPKYGVKNAQQFVKSMKNIKISDGNILASFDVVNCYGNIPTKLAMDIIARDFNLVEEHTPIPKDQFMKLLDLCLNKANYFVYKGKFYKQNLGMFMGSSLAPIMVERVIEDFVDRAITDLKISPDFWSTYVDDHLTSIPETMVDPLNEKLNSYDKDKNVRFTVERQNSETKSINFLDLTVLNESPKLKTKWYHKDIASNRILNYHSKHPHNMILNVAKAFIKRVLTVSHRSFHGENLAKIREILHKNSFPNEVIKQLIHQVKSRPTLQPSKSEKSYPLLDDTKPVLRIGPLANSTMITNKDISFKELTTSPKPIYPKYALGFAGITYIPGVSDTIKHQLKRHAPNLKLAVRPACKISQVFSNMKEKLKTGQQSNVVYSIPCKQCQGRYIGETTQRYSDRSSQHQNDVKNARKKPKKSALVRHTVKAKHEFDFENGTILKKVRSKGLLKIHEANQIILHEKEAVNFKKDAKHISPVFYNLIKHHKKLKKPPKRNPSNLPPYKGNETTPKPQSEPTDLSENPIV